MKNKNKNFRDFEDIAIELLHEDPKMAKEFLRTAVKNYEKNGNEKEFLLALRYATLASGGFVKLSKKTGLSRTSLYKTLSKDGNPQFSTVKTILEFFGFSISFVAA